MERRVYREDRIKVTDEIKRTVSRLIDQEKDWEFKKKHPSRWYRAETAKILGLDESANPSLRSYEELCRATRKNARIQNPADKPWNTALLESEMLDPELIPWVINAQANLKKYLSKPLTIREVKWFAKLFGFRSHFKPITEVDKDPELKFLFLTNVLNSWAQVYAEREKVDSIAGIDEPDYSDLDLAIVHNDFSQIREYSDEKLSDQVHDMLGKKRELTENQWSKIQEEWTLPSLRHNVLILESRILGHSLGDPDMSPEYLRAYHNLLFRYDYGRYEEDYGATYEKRIETFLGFRKQVKDTKEDEIELINSVLSEFDLWWEQSWGKKQVAKEANKEGD